MTTNQTLVLICLCLLVSFDALHLAAGQAYHFSKGWMPGRKRGYDGQINGVQAASIYDGDSSSDLKTSAVACQVRPQVKEMITQLVKVLFFQIFFMCNKQFPQEINKKV